MEKKTTSENQKKAVSQTMKEKWADPEWRANIIKKQEALGFRTPKQPMTQKESEEQDERELDSELYGDEFILPND